MSALGRLHFGIAMNAKISMIAICVEAIIYLLLYSLHDCTFNIEKYINATKPSEVVVRRCSTEKVVLKISQNSQENTCVRLSFLQPPACNFKKRDSGTGVYLWILRKFQEQLFCRTSPGDCFFHANVFQYFCTNCLD